jgi:hypothetical protein
MRSVHAKQWKEAADSEYRSLIETGTWELVELPPGRQTVSSKWIFKVKYNADGSVARLKARLVARGYSQEAGIDYVETFSPVAKYVSIRALLAIAVETGMSVHQMDVKTAFLNGVLDEEIYMDQPEGYVIAGKESLVCRLKKSLYGLKQAARCWNRTLDRFRKGFRCCAYSKTRESKC